MDCVKRLLIHASTSARTNAIRSPNKRTIGGNKPSFVYFRMVERGQPVSFTVSGIWIKGEITASFESVVIVLLSKEHHTHLSGFLVVKRQSVQKKEFF